MLEKLTEELGLRFCGKWEDVAGYIFRINNPNMVSYKASFTVFDTDKLSLMRAMNETETKWINTKLKERKKEVNLYV